MKREKVTYDEVVAACKALVERGDNPSVRNVLQEVGGGGSQTIAAHLSAWRLEQASAAEAQQAITSQHISQELIQSLLAEINRHKEQASATLGIHLATAQDDMAAMREELAQALQRADDLREALEAAQHEAVAARQQQAVEVATQTALLGESQRHVARLNQELEATLTTLAQERVNLAQLRATSTALQTRNEELAAEVKGAVSAREAWHLEQRALRQSVADLQYAVFEAEKKAAVAQEQVSGRDVAMAKQEEALQATQQERRALAEQNAAMAQKLESALRRADMAEIRLQAATHAATPKTDVSISVDKDSPAENQDSAN